MERRECHGQREIVLFRGHAEADRGGIGYHSLTPNTFTADTMINERGAVLHTH